MFKICFHLINTGQGQETFQRDKRCKLKRRQKQFSHLHIHFEGYIIVFIRILFKRKTKLKNYEKLEYIKNHAKTGNLTLVFLHIF